MADIAYYSNEDASGGIGGEEDPNATSDSSGIGGGGSVQDNTGNFNAPGDITGLGFGGVGAGPGGPGGPGGYFFGGGDAGGFNAPGDLTGMGFGGVGSNYTPYSGVGSLGDLAGAAMGGGAGGGFGIPGDITGLGFGNTGASGNFGIPPSLAGSTGLPALQSSIDLNQPSPITAGAQDQGAPQAAPGGQLSGQPPSMMDQLAQLLGGINPISSARAAEEPPQGSSQDTLTEGDITAAPFKGPWTGTDTGTGLQLGAPYGQLPPENPALPNENWAGFDPQAGTEAAPSGGAPPPAGGGAGWFSPDAFAGGEAAPLGGAPAPSGGAGWFVPDPFAGGEAAPEGGGSVDLQIPGNTGPPSGFLGDTGSGIPGMFAGGGLVPGSTGAPLRASSDGGVTTVRETSPVGTDFSPTAMGVPPGSFQIPANEAPFAGNNRFAAGDQPDRATTGDLLDLASRANQAVPPNDNAANLAIQGVDATPPGGNLTGGGQGMDPITGAPAPGFRVLGTTGDTATPPVPGSPVDIEQRGVTNVTETSPVGTDFSPTAMGAPPGSFKIPTNEAPFAGPNRFAVPDQSTPPAPRSAAPAPGSGGGAGPGAAPAAPGPGGGGASVAAGPGGAGDLGQRGGFERGRRPGGLHNVIASMFGGGQLGDTVASLMLQLGIPAALIMAAARGGGGAGRLGLLGGRAAMSGAGRGAFVPQFSRNLFPGTGVPPWLIPGVAGAMVGQRLDQPPQQPPQDHPPVMPGRPPDTPSATSPAGFTVPRGRGNMPLPTAVDAQGRPLTQAQLAADRAQAPGGVISYIQSRGGHTAGAGAPDLNPAFAARVQRAAQAYEAETGRRAVFDEMGRSKEQQGIYYDRFLRGGPRAAPPETGRHVKGLAIDIPDGDFQSWMHRNAWKFGLEGLRPELNDPNHFQMSSA